MEIPTNAVEIKNFDLSDYDVDPSLIEYEGLFIGDAIRFVDDDDMAGIWEGDKGTILGFSHRPPAADPALAAALGGSVEGGVEAIIGVEGYDEPVAVIESSFSLFEAI